MHPADATRLCLCPLNYSCQYSVFFALFFVLLCQFLSILVSPLSGLCLVFLVCSFLSVWSFLSFWSFWSFPPFACSGLVSLVGSSAVPSLPFTRCPFALSATCQYPAGPAITRVLFSVLAAFTLPSQIDTKLVARAPRHSGRCDTPAQCFIASSNTASHVKRIC